MVHPLGFESRAEPTIIENKQGLKLQFLIKMLDPWMNLEGIMLCEIAQTEKDLNSFRSLLNDQGA